MYKNERLLIEPICDARRSQNVIVNTITIFKDMIDEANK
jgi:hypothetical protein